MGEPEAAKPGENIETPAPAEAAKLDPLVPATAADTRKPQEALPLAANNKATEPSSEAAAKGLEEPLKPDEALPSHTGASWPELSADHPLSEFLAGLPDILKKAEYDEVYGINLKPKAAEGSGDFYTLLILQKFLRANKNELDPAKQQLSKTLAWRKEYRPDKALSETFKTEKWNIYGAVKDYEKTFVPLEE
jgi:hypothetical protein